MNCSRCGNYINNVKECILCLDKFCSEECITHHNQFFHQSNIEQSHNDNIVNNNSFFNYARESMNIQSPFLVGGIMNYDYIVYDPIYSPDNFTYIYSNGVKKSCGNGSFGQVYLAINNIDKKTYAIKHMDKDKLIKYLQCLDPIYAEIDIQSRVNHPNIIKLLYVKETEATFDLVMDYAKDGTLFEYVVKNKGLPERMAFKYFIQIVNAIKFLHDNDIIHRDIKPENILLFENNVVKLCDFGWSIKCVDHLPGGSFTGTTEYMAPELIDNMDYGKEIDLWMLGILLYELIHGFSPFRPKKATFEDNEVVYNIKNHNISFYMPVSEDCKQLIFSLLEMDKNKRCTIDGIFNSQLVKNFEKEEFDINTSYIDGEEIINLDNTPISHSLIFSNLNNEYTTDKNQMKITKSQLLNRYAESEKIDDFIGIPSQKTNNSKKIEQNYQFFNIKKVEKDNFKNSKITDNNENYLLNNKEQNVKNSLEVDDPYEDEPNAPKNNRRNRIKNKKNNINNSIVKLINNEGILTPLKYKEEKNKQNTIASSPKNNNKRKNILNNNLVLNLNPNTILNNNLRTSRGFREKEEKKETNKNKENRGISQESNNVRKRSVITNIDSNIYKKVKSEITNYIFNNIKEVNIKSKKMPKKITLNASNQPLSLSLSPGSGEYNSLLTRSMSPQRSLAFQKEKNDQIFNGKNLMEISDNLSNTSHNLRDYPFDHFASNSSLDIRNPIQSKNNENYEGKINENDDDEIFEIKEKEPNDNMRRKNIRKDIPSDNYVRNKINSMTKNVRPKDSTSKIGRIKKNIDNIEKKYEVKTVNSAINETVNVNNLNQIGNNVIKKIKDNQIISKNTPVRNLSVKASDNIRSKRLNSEDFKKNPFIKSNQKTSREKKNNLNLKVKIKSNLKGVISPKIIKKNRMNDKHSPFNKNNNNKNMSFIGKTKIKMICNNDNNNNNKERRQKFLDNKREKKGGSVNKPLKSFRRPKLTKVKNEIKEIKQIQNLNKNNQEKKENDIKEIVNKDNNIHPFVKNDEKENSDIIEKYKVIGNEYIKTKESKKKENNEDEGNKENNDNKEDNDNKNKNIDVKEIVKEKENLEIKETQMIENLEKNEENKENNENIENKNNTINKDNENAETNQENNEDNKQNNDNIEENNKNKEEQINNEIKEEQNKEKEEVELNKESKDLDNNIKNIEPKKEIVDTNENKENENIDNKPKKEEIVTIQEKSVTPCEETDINKDKEKDEEKINNDKCNINDNFIDKKNDNTLIVKERSEVSESNLYKEIVESKYNSSIENQNNIEQKEISQIGNNILHNQIIKQKKVAENKNKKAGIRLKKRIISNNQNNNIVENQQQNQLILAKAAPTLEKPNGRDMKKEENYILNKGNLVIKTIDIDKSDKEPKDKIQKKVKRGEKKYSKGKKYTKVKMDPSKDIPMLNKINNNNNTQNLRKKLPKKINTKIKLSNEQLTNSSAYEYKIDNLRQIKEENIMKNQYNLKTNGSNSESKTTSYSKNNINNIKEKIKCFSVINEDLNINFSKSKSPDTRKQLCFKNKLEKKGDLIFGSDPNSNLNNNNIRQAKKITQVKKEDKNSVNNENDIKNDKIENKENIEINKENNNEKKEINNLKNINIIKKTKKKNRKMKSIDNLIEEKEQNEKNNNDSESFIIDGDSEYGDSEVF